MSNLSFSSLDLHPSLTSNLATLGYKEMTTIQAQSLPEIIRGKDVIAQGQTGSGKTAAFGLGVLQRLEVKRFRIQSLVLCPTRELADQVSSEIRKLGRGIHNIKVLTLCGGMPFGPQVGSLEHGAHIIVGTPGRVEEHIRKGNLHLLDLNTFVLDEADRMLDMGFQEALDNIIDAMPSKRQTLLFSATFPDSIQAIARRIMQSPITVKVESTHNQQSIDHQAYLLDDGLSRMEALQQLLHHHNPESAVVFCNTKREAQDTADELRANGFSALAMHGDLEQKDRDQTLIRFANKSLSILVATDVAARGLDIDNLDLVISLSVPRDLDAHTHRIGRTGRAGQQGVACTLFSGKETHRLGRLEEHLDQVLIRGELPEDIPLSQSAYQPQMTTLQIDGGKKQKVRAGDILGALTSDAGKSSDKSITGKQVGKIHLTDNRAFVAVQRDIVKTALKKLQNGKIKGRTFKVRQLSN